MEAVLSLLLAVVLMLGAALWWQSGARLVNEPALRGDVWLARFLQRVGAWESNRPGHKRDPMSQVQLSYAVADAEALSNFRYALLRWTGGLAMLAGAGWLVGNAVATESNRPTRETLAFVTLGVVGAGVALSSIWMWRLYPWWHEHNPVERAITRMFLGAMRDAEVSDARRRAKGWPGGMAANERYLREESARADGDYAEGMSAAWRLGRVGFAGLPVALGLLVVLIAFAELFL